MNRLTLFAMLCMALMSVSAFALPSSMTVAYDSLITSAGNHSVNVSYVDNMSSPILGATVAVCYSYQNASSCFSAPWNGALYQFQYAYNGVNSGLLAFNVTASNASYDPSYASFGTVLSDANFTVKFFLDYTKANSYVDDTLTIYAYPSCSGLSGADLFQCNLTAVHGAYVNGTSYLYMYPENWTLYVTDGNAVFADSSSRPVITGEQTNVAFDEITVISGEVGHGNYVWDASGFSFGINWGFWSSVVGLIGLLITVCVVAYLSKSGVATVIAFLIVYIILKYLGILSGAIFWIF